MDLFFDWLGERVILVTVHRRENWGERLALIADGMLRVLDSHPDIDLLLPLHHPLSLVGILDH